jgi:O-acetyl-ADP-ribose deacetylase (regulator of RNase III)
VIREVTGDILLSRAHVIAHGVSPNDDFHQGLALALREQWPALYKDFRHYCQTRSPDPGTVWTWMGADGRPVVNLFTQSAPEGHAGKPGRATVGHVNHCLKELHRLAVAEQWKSIALPRLATGVGGLDWKDVRPLVEQHLGAGPAQVVIYATYRKGVAADEGLSKAA